MTLFPSFGIHINMQKNRSEGVFEGWLDANRLEWRPIPPGPSRTPDYVVTVAPGVEVIFELKQIETARDWKEDVVHGGEVGASIRERINRSKSQIKASSAEGRAAVLVVFNHYDPMQLSGTENHDFIAAMYGGYTLKLGAESRRITGRFLGDGKLFQSNKNTSFSALARLKQSGREAVPNVTIFENIHALNPLDYGALPRCFEVVRFESDTPKAPSAGDRASLP
ncbi:hypothetical protein [Mesorhizobium shangrilense]|uniref:Uncharacterized protein n=1 Tax=Mesorhizobium shangrilense TaxID=460060 RepID=A0ABV2D853_9HYPH